MKVDNVTTRDMPGYMQRSMRLLDKPGTPVVTDNIRVLETAQEITFRAVMNGQETEEERVFAVRSDPLRMEMWKRHSRDEMRLDWQAPRAVVNDIFKAVSAAASPPIIAQCLGSRPQVGSCEKFIGMGWTS